MGQYYIYYATNSDGTLSKNKNDNYLKSKSNEIYRYSEDTLAILLVSGTASVNTLVPKFEAEGIKVWNIISPDCCEEAVIGINECDIHKVHNIMKFQTMHSKQQLKESQTKQKIKEEKLKLKESKNNISN